MVAGLERIVTHGDQHEPSDDSKVGDCRRAPADPAQFMFGPRLQGEVCEGRQASAGGTRLLGGSASDARAKASPQAALYEDEAFAAVREQIFARAPVQPERLAHEVFQRAVRPSLLIEEVEALWSPIAEADDWSAFETKLADIEALRLARWG